MIYEKVNRYFEEANQKYMVCAHPMTEAELPRAMEQYGFRDVSTAYIVLDLTPDHPGCPAAFAEAIINAGRSVELDEISFYPVIAPGVVTQTEQAHMGALANVRYDERLRLYRVGEKQWDTSVLLLMIARGLK